MNERQYVQRLVRLYDQHWCFPNVYFAGGEMDLAIVTKGGRYLWEIEVKLSLSDWRADVTKRKWSSPDRVLVSRFYYAVTKDMLGGIPDFVPPSVGLIVYDIWPRVHRPAKRSKALPVSDAHMLQFFGSVYHRFWRERSRRIRLEDRLEGMKRQGVQL